MARCGNPIWRLPKRVVSVVIWMGISLAILTLRFPGHSLAASAAPTFTGDVAPILFKNCVKCHAEGEIASRAPLTSYDAAAPLAEKIKQKVMAREMPPWPADPTRSVKFRNDARLGQQDIDTIVEWVNAGTPKGDDQDLPPLPQSSEGWTQSLGRKPDLVIALPGKMHVPATGEIPYVRLLVKVPLEEDRWVSAIQTHPTNASVVHHMALTEVALPPGMDPSSVEQMARQLGVAPQVVSQPAVKTPTKPRQIDMLGIYAPGSTLEVYRDGTAKLLKGGKNMYLDFNIHYETTGKPETDQSAIAFWFQSRPPKSQLFRVNGAGEVILANGNELLTDTPGTKAEGTHVAIPPIPPSAENYELVGMTAYPEPITIYQFQPHAHHRARDFTYMVVYPDGREETLLTVPKYDHRWQMAYEPETPVKLPAGSKLVVKADYNNSTGNMHNHSSHEPVYFRDQNQSWDEMFTPFIQYSVDLPTNPAGAAEPGLKSDSNISGQQPRSLEIDELVGCLETNPAGEWQLSKAGQPAESGTEATTSAAIKSAESKPLGSQRYFLLGTRWFQPGEHLGQKVVVKGVVIPEPKEARINVTSLQSVAAACTTGSASR
jgi:hypothetical protein